MMMASQAIYEKKRMPDVSSADTIFLAALVVARAKGACAEYNLLHALVCKHLITGLYACIYYASIKC